MTISSIDELVGLWQGTLTLGDLFCINLLYKGEYKRAIGSYAAFCQSNASDPVRRWFQVMTDSGSHETMPRK